MSMASAQITRTSLHMRCEEALTCVGLPCGGSPSTIANIAAIGIMSQKGCFVSITKKKISMYHLPLLTVGVNGSCSDNSSGIESESECVCEVMN